jgi:hypothetical protein
MIEGAFGNFVIAENIPMQIRPGNILKGIGILVFFKSICTFIEFYHGFLFRISKIRRFDC